MTVSSIVQKETKPDFQFLRHIENRMTQKKNSMSRNVNWKDMAIKKKGLWNHDKIEIH